MTAELCTLCEERPATTSWGLPVCDECHGFLGRLDVELKAMEDADPELAALAGIFEDRTKPYRERAREAIAARRQEQALPDQFRQLAERPAVTDTVGRRCANRAPDATRAEGAQVALSCVLADGHPGPHAAAVRIGDAAPTWYGWGR